METLDQDLALPRCYDSFVGLLLLGRPRVSALAATSEDTAGFLAHRSFGLSLQI